MEGESKKADSSVAVEKQERGRQSYKKGHKFEGRVAELYRLLHYEVELRRNFSSREVDLFLTQRFGDYTVNRAIECKSGAVKADHIDSFIAKLELVRKVYPTATGTIVSGTSFTNSIKEHAAAVGMQLTLLRDLAAQLFDGHQYARNVIKEVRSNELYPFDLYVEAHVGFGTKGGAELAFEFIDAWLADLESKQLTLLGDVGTGKSFLSRMVAFRLAEKYLEDPINYPLPFLIDLRNADREFSLEGLIRTHLAQTGLGQVTFDIFQHALSNGHIVLLLDGFDEMAARVTPQVTTRNFHELARCVKGRAKVMLTCRTHYFKSRTEEEEVILGGETDYAPEIARELYFDLISRSGFQIAYLRPFTISQIEEYVRRARPQSAKRDLKKIRKTYNLMELSQRPMLLDMIVKSLDKLGRKDVNASTLYEVYTKAWIHRDKWRDVLPAKAKLEFLTGLAWSLWNEGLTQIHYTKLADYLHQELGNQIQDPVRLLEVDSEIRTASFLTRDDQGHYGFAHKSYMEFFIARYLAERLAARDTDCLNIKRVSTEILEFLSSTLAFLENRIGEIEPLRQVA